MLASLRPGTITPVTIYQRERNWYAIGGAYRQYPDIAQRFRISDQRLDDPVPFAHRYEAAIAYGRAQGALPGDGADVIWVVSSRQIGGRRVTMWRHGAVLATCGSYATVQTATGHTERIRLDQLIMVELAEVATWTR